MDHFFQKKLINENNELKRELAQSNRKIKHLSEQIRNYEQLINKFNEDVQTDARAQQMNDMIIGAAELEARQKHLARHSQEPLQRRLHKTIAKVYGKYGAALVGKDRKEKESTQVFGVDGRVQPNMPLYDNENASKVGEDGINQNPKPTGMSSQPILKKPQFTQYIDKPTTNIQTSQEHGSKPQHKPNIQIKKPRSK